MSEPSPGAVTVTVKLVVPSDGSLDEIEIATSLSGGELKTTENDVVPPASVVVRPVAEESINV